MDHEKPYQAGTKVLSGHLTIPAGTSALLWDMDGVLIDSLTFDQQLCGALFSDALGEKVTFAPPLIRSLFAYDPKTFIAKLAEAAGTQRGAVLPPEQIQTILADYEAKRRHAIFPLLPGLPELLAHARALGLKQAVVSNNATTDIAQILHACGIAALFDGVIGNDLAVDGQLLRKKPAPDYYLHAAHLLHVPPRDCVVFEDSVIGCAAGLQAGAHVIGLLTGGTTAEQLRQAPLRPHEIYPDLTQARLT